MSIELVKKFKVGLWFSDMKQTPGWIRAEKSTAFDLALNPTTAQRDYIVDQHPTTEVDDYAPTLNQAITMYKGNPDYELLFPKAYDLPIGEKAKNDVLIVFMQEPIYEEADIEAFEQGVTYYTEGSDGSYERVPAGAEFDSSETYYTLLGYKAWKTNATLSFTNINTVESTLTVDINFGGIIEKGYATPAQTTHQPVFTRTQDDGSSWTDPFTV